jgi:hypothetical protein
MMEEARDKVQGLKDRGDCQTIVDESCPRPADQKTFFMSNCVEDADKPAWRAALADKGDKCKSQQVDHIKEVQCGGDNDCDNLEPLTQVERGLLYDVRSYARFRKLFHVAIAAGGELAQQDPPEDHLAALHLPKITQIISALSQIIRMGASAWNLA